MNYEALLQKYMAHILSQEGRLYLDSYLVYEELDYDTDPPTVAKPAVFTPEELARLEAIAERLRKKP